MKKKRHGMHGASIKSERLQAVLSELRRMRLDGVSGLMLEERAQVRAAGTCVSELRRLGYDIGCEYAGEGKRPGSRVYMYRIIEEP